MCESIAGICGVITDRRLGGPQIYIAGMTIHSCRDNRRRCQSSWRSFGGNTHINPRRNGRGCETDGEFPALNAGRKRRGRHLEWNTAARVSYLFQYRIRNKIPPHYVFMAVSRHLEYHITHGGAGYSRRDASPSPR